MASMPAYSRNFISIICMCVYVGVWLRAREVGVVVEVVVVVVVVVVQRREV